MENTKKITKVIPDAIAENVFKFFYESIEPYRNKFEYSDTRIIDGKKVTYDHVVFERERYTPKKNCFELFDVEWKAKLKKGAVRHTIPVVMSFETLQLDSDSVFVAIKYSPFFEDIIQGLLSHFDNKPKSKKRKTGNEIPKVVLNNEERIREVMAMKINRQGKAGKFFIDIRQWERYVSGIKKLDELRKKAT